MKLSEVFGGFFTAAKEAGIPIEADDPVKLAEPAKATEQAPVTADTSALEATVAAQQTALTAAQERIAAMETDARTTRLEATVAHWAGDKATHLQILGALGEGTPNFAAYVTQQKAHTEQLRQSKLFAPAGSEQAGAAGGAYAQIEAQAKALMEKEPGLTRAKAILRVAESDKELYAQYRAES